MYVASSYNLQTTTGCIVNCDNPGVFSVSWMLIDGATLLEPYDGPQGPQVSDWEVRCM